MKWRHAQEAERRKNEQEVIGDHDIMNQEDLMMTDNELDINEHSSDDDSK